MSRAPRTLPDYDAKDVERYTVALLTALERMKRKDPKRAFHGADVPLSMLMKFRQSMIKQGLIKYDDL
jgi:hypothetical protein